MSRQQPSSATARLRLRSVVPWRLVVIGCTVMVLMGLKVAFGGTPVPYAVCGPGEAYNVLGQAQRDGAVSDRIAVANAPTYPSSGSLVQTNVDCVRAGYGLDGVLKATRGWLVGHLDVFSNADRPQGDDWAREAYLMPLAQTGIALLRPQEVSRYVGTGAAGYPAELRAVVMNERGAYEQSGLKEFDRILSISGSPENDVDAMLTALSNARAGDWIDVTVRRAGAIVTVRSQTDDDGHGGASLRASVWLRLSNDPEFVNLDSLSWSASLVYALGVHDKLTEGSLTGGRSVGGAGALDHRGVVWPVSDVPLRMIGARDAGADFFLTPAANCTEATERRPDGLTLVRVETFEQARRAVEAIGRGDTGSLPPC